VTGVDPGPAIELRAQGSQASLFVPDGWRQEETAHGTVLSR
jgi:hypothetical protein